MPRKFSFKVLTLVLLSCSFSTYAFDLKSGSPSLLKTKDQIRLALWYEGITSKEETTPLSERLPEDFKNFILPVELSHPLNEWKI